jgi:putative transposase
LKKIINPEGVVPELGMRMVRLDCLYLFDSSLGFAVPMVRGSFMPQSLSSVYLHVIFSTKDRQPFLRDLDLRRSTHAYLGSISSQISCPPVIAGGVEDHVHVLARLSRTVSQADWVKELKRVSSAWLKPQSPSLKNFAWQSGYGIFSVSLQNLAEVEHYIQNQEEHHRKQSFQQEYRDFLRCHGIEWQEDYVWD